MASVFQCDRCKDFEVKQPYSRNRGHHHGTISIYLNDDEEPSETRTNYELCISCYQEVINLLTTIPVRPIK